MKKHTRIAGSPNATWKKLAASIAEEAHEENFSSRRGTGLIAAANDKTVGFYLYDNNPYANDPERRGREHADLIAYLATRRARLAASAAYGENGYTVAHIFIVDGAEHVAEKFVTAIQDAAMMRFRDIMEAESNALEALTAFIAKHEGKS